MWYSAIFKTDKKLFSVFSKIFCQYKKFIYICTRNQIRSHGRLAQLVQSIWFTPRGSGVRIPQRPQKEVKKGFLFYVLNFPGPRSFFRIIQRAGDPIDIFPTGEFLYQIEAGTAKIDDHFFRIRIIQSILQRKEELLFFRFKESFIGP